MEQRVSLITLGVGDLPRARRFYEQGLGWRPGPIATDEVVFYQAGGLIVALYRVELLAQDAGRPTAGAPPAFRGMSLAHNLPSAQRVDELLAEVVRAGGRIAKPAEQKEWGGYSGYFADPDGHLWEVAWNPGFPLQADGTIRLPGQGA
jgi:uncharacterized protein